MKYNSERADSKMPMNHFLRARVPEWEKRYVRDKAARAHITESEFVRFAAMDRDVTVIEGLDDLVTELRRQGNNLNQLTVLARQGRIQLVDLEPFLEVYKQTWQTLNSLLSHVV
jgi:hypothetical protein